MVKVLLDSYFPKTEDIIHWVYVYGVRDGIVLFNIANGNWTQGEMEIKEFLSKYYHVPYDGDY
ncbi:hypothetical protein V7128_01095 [Neobacillus vireti]|uniref:hypothetical protein n=1 Tax=Neobacillus vireti TaxID=220686 RepID=UPI0030008418